MFYEYDAGFSALSPAWRTVRDLVVAERYDRLPEAVETGIASTITNEADALVAVGALARVQSAARSMSPGDDPFAPQPPPFDPTILGSWATAPRVEAVLLLAWIPVYGLKESERRAERAVQAASGRAEDLLRATHLAILGTQERHDAVTERARALDARTIDPRDLPWIGYMVGTALANVRRWDDAIPWLERALASAPEWVRARMTLARVLTAAGRTEAADVHRARAFHDAPDHPVVRREKVVEAWLARDWRAVVDGCSRMRSGREATDNDARTDFAAVEVFARWKVGERKEALALAERAAPAMAARLARLPASQAGEVHVPVERFVQDRYMCAATSLSMLLGTLGRPIPSHEIYAAMDGGNGLTDPQIDRWLEGQGLIRVSLGTNLAWIRQCLAAGRPLLCISSQLQSSHMELLVGLHDDLQMVETIDPSSGMMGLCNVEDLDRAFGNVGEGVSVVVPAGAHDAVADVITAARASLPDRLRRIRTLAWFGEIDAAEVLYAQVPAGPHADLLSWRMVETLCDSTDAGPIRARLASSDDVPLTIRADALLSAPGTLGAAGVQEIEAVIEALPPLEAELRRAMLASRQGAWEKACHHIERVLRVLSAESVWTQYANVLDQLDRVEDAEAALAIARDVAPDSIAVTLSDLRMRPPRTLDARRAALARLLVLIQRAPHHVGLRHEAIHLACQVGDPEQARSLVLEGLRVLPRSHHMASLATVYFDLHESRADLRVEALQRHARGGVLRLPIAATIPPLGQPKAEVSDPVQEAAPGELGFDELLQRVRMAEVSAGRPCADELARRIEHDPGCTQQQQFDGRLELAVRALRANRSMTRDALAACLPSHAPRPVVRNVCGFAQRLLEAGPRPGLAVTMLRWFDSLVPSAEVSRDASHTRALILNSAGFGVEASDVLHGLMERWNDPSAFRPLAHIAQVDGRNDEALAYLQSHLREEPGDMRALSTAMRLAEVLGQENLVAEFEKECRRRAPRNLSYALDEVEDLVDEVSTDAARARAEEGRANFGTWLVDFVNGFDAASSSRWAEAAACIPDALLLADPSRISDVLDWYRAAEEPQKLSEFVGKLRRDPRTRNLHAVLSAAVAGAEDIKGERAIYLEHFLETGAFESANQWAARIQVAALPHQMQQVLATLPAHVSRHEVLSVFRSVLMNLGEPVHARGLLDWVLASEPPTLELLSMAMTHAAQTSDEALTAWAAAQLAPMVLDESDLLLPVAQALRSSQPEESLRLVRAAFERSNSPSLLIYLCDLHREQGRLAEVEGLILASLERYPSQPAAVRALAELNVAPEILRPYIMQALARRPDGTQPGFVVTVAEWALRNQTMLPHAWEEWAIARLARVLAMSSRSQDEQREAEELCSAMRAWCVLRGRMWRLAECFAQPSITRRHVRNTSLASYLRRPRWCVDVDAMSGRDRLLLRLRRIQLRWYPSSMPIGFTAEPATFRGRALVMT